MDSHTAEADYLYLPTCCEYEIGSAERKRENATKVSRKRGIGSFKQPSRLQTIPLINEPITWSCDNLASASRLLCSVAECLSCLKEEVG